MPGFSISMLSAFFSITTVIVLLYPIIRLAPSWLERRVYRQIAFHRAAVAALTTEIDRAHNDRPHHDRVQGQLDYHRAALAALAPSAPVPAAPARRNAA